MTAYHVRLPTPCQQQWHPKTPPHHHLLLYPPQFRRQATSRKRKIDFDIFITYHFFKLQC